MENYELFNTTETLSWSKRWGLIPEEEYLFDKYIHPQPRASKILDVGTGNGRFLVALNRVGFSYLTGFDLSVKLISSGQEKTRQENLPIDFLLMDAVEMGFKGQQFDIVLALQQIMSLIQTKKQRLKAINECYRVLRPGGVLIMSFLHFPGRWYNKIVSPITIPMKIFRGEFEFINYKYLPWLSLGGKININYFIEKQPYLYWATVKDVLETLKESGFNIMNYVTSRMIKENRSDLTSGGHLYVAATK